MVLRLVEVFRGIPVVSAGPVIEETSKAMPPQNPISGFDQFHIVKGSQFTRNQYIEYSQCNCMATLEDMLDEVSVINDRLRWPGTDQQGYKL